MTTIRVDHDAVARVKSLGSLALASIKIILTCYLIATAAVLPVQAQTNTFPATNLPQTWTGQQTFGPVIFVNLLDASGASVTRPARVVSTAQIPNSCLANTDVIIVSDSALVSAKYRLCNANGNGFDIVAGTTIPGQQTVDGLTNLNIQAAVNAAGTTGFVVIPSSYAGVDTYTNANHVPLIDLRANSFKVNNLGNIRIANAFSGGDIGAKVNAADADLGATAGEIWVLGGGNFATQVTISSNHTLRLFPGTYTSSVGTGSAGTPWSPTFAMGNISNLRCEGWNTIIKETTDPTQFPTIVGPKAMFATLGVKTATATSSGIAVEGCHFQGVGLTPNTFGGTVEVGNTVGMKVLNNWFDAVQSISTNVGGGSGTGNFGDNVEIAGNLITGSIEVEMSIVNGQNVNIHDNIYRDPGTTGAGMIDVEPNVSTDRAKNIDIHDNDFDLRAGTGGSYFCVTLQIGSISNATQQGIRVHDNICRGSDPSVGGGHLINGFTMTGKYVDVYNNTIVGAIQGGITAGTLDNGTIHDNTLICSSQLGYNVFDIEFTGNVTNSTVYNNKIVNDPSCPGALPPKKANIGEIGSGNANNYFWNNQAQGITLNGTGSRILTTTDPAGDFAVTSAAFGIGTTLNGGVSMAPLAAPTLQLIRTTAGGSFTAGTYFWKVTAVNAVGETAGSNEVTGSPALNQMAELQWTASPGATSYKIYRSSTTGTETLCTTVSSGAVFYQDPGTACSGAAVPTSNTSLGISGVESPAPGGIASSDLLWPDVASHCWKINNNNGTAVCLSGSLPRVTDTVDLVSVATGACTAERTVGVSNAAFGDPVDVVAATALEAGGFLIGKVTSAGNTKWQFCNLSGGNIDRASDTYTVIVRKHP